MIKYGPASQNGKSSKEPPSPTPTVNETGLVKFLNKAGRFIQFSKKEMISRRGWSEDSLHFLDTLPLEYLLSTSYFVISADENENSLYGVLRSIDIPHEKIKLVPSLPGWFAPKSRELEFSGGYSSPLMSSIDRKLYARGLGKRAEANKKYYHRNFPVLVGKTKSEGEDFDLRERLILQNLDQAREQLQVKSEAVGRGKVQNLPVEKEFKHEVIQAFGVPYLKKKARVYYVGNDFYVYDSNSPKATRAEIEHHTKFSYLLANGVNSEQGFSIKKDIGKAKHKQVFDLLFFSGFLKQIILNQDFSLHFNLQSRRFYTYGNKVSQRLYKDLASFEVEHSVNPIDLEGEQEKVLVSNPLMLIRKILTNNSSRRDHASFAQQEILEQLHKRLRGDFATSVGSTVNESDRYWPRDLDQEEPVGWRENLLNFFGL